MDFSLVLLTVTCKVCENCGFVHRSKSFSHTHIIIIITLIEQSREIWFDWCYHQLEVVTSQQLHNGLVSKTKTENLHITCSNLFLWFRIYESHILLSSSLYVYSNWNSKKKTFRMKKNFIFKKKCVPSQYIQFTYDYSENRIVC